jgi:DNA polymerase II large subunit
MPDIKPRLLMQTRKLPREILDDIIKQQEQPQPIRYEEALRRIREITIHPTHIMASDTISAVVYDVYKIIMSLPESERRNLLEVDKLEKLSESIVTALVKNSTFKVNLLSVKVPIPKPIVSFLSKKFVSRAFKQLRTLLSAAKGV